jgi:PHD/YefM family antitoxin component YafN of YafNO toxin-antitoxin module
VPAGRRSPLLGTALGLPYDIVLLARDLLVSHDMLVKEIPANDVRITVPQRGEVLVVKRYNKPQAVILHPEDYLSIEAIIDRYLTQPPFDATASDVAVRGHEITNEREGDDYDYDGLAAALEAE